MKKRLRRTIRTLPRTTCSLLPLFAAGLLASPPALARPGVPASAMPSANALPVPSTGRSFVYSGSATVGTAGNVMTVTSATRTTGLNWDGFWVGSDATVNFNYATAGDPNFRVLNRIWSADPSVILGKINSLGQIYLINQNGILFGNGSQVNVGGLVASALNVSDDLLTRGLPVNRGESLRFNWEGDAAGFANGFVAVDSGARISSGGRIVLLAPALAENNGNILRIGADGETILAAGGSVLLAVPDDPNLRGLLVQVDSWQGKDALGNNVTLGGTAANRSGAAIGREPTDHGSDGGVVTLAALAVNQEGTVKAGKAVNLNGQIMLVASAPETPLLTINQSGDTAQVDWTGGFAPVDAAHKVEFVQPTSGAVAYNFVNDPSRTATGTGGRTTIDGTLGANGQIFLVNEKGIDFGAGARVSASSFVASGLGLTPSMLATGLLSQTNVASPAFALFPTDPTAKTAEEVATLSASSLAAFRQATVNVASGANIDTTGSGGVAILAGAQVNQSGRISTPGGQTILAAGAKLYLKAPYSQLLRGFKAEVDPLYVVDGSSPDNRKVILSRGADVNSVTQRGTVTAALGNITLVGHDVTQAGILTTSTSVTSNGSIDLLARDLVMITRRDVVNGQVTTGESLAKTAEAFEFGSQGGTLVLDKGSATQVLLDGNDGRTVTAQQAFASSSIAAEAAKIDIVGAGDGQAGATIAARNGNIQLIALGSFDTTNAFPVDAPVIPKTATPSPDVGLFVGAGARLDASGATAQKSVADLFIDVQLRGDELAGNPVQRFGALRGKTATVDIRDKVAIADLSGYINQVGQTLDERAATGGTIDLRSGGSLIVKPDAVLDVSGGSVNYAAATVNESKVIVGRGQTYRLNDVPATAPVIGLTTTSHAEAAYVEGKSAGSVKLQGNSLAVAGTLLGGTVRGGRQRNIGDPTSDRTAIPLGGQLVVRDAGQHAQPVDGSVAAMDDAYGQAQVRFIAGRSATADGLEFGSPAGPTLELSESLIGAGFSRFDIQSDGRIDIAAGMNLALAPGGQFSASGRQVFVGGDIAAPNGTIALTTRETGSGAPAKYSTLIVDGGAALSTAGQWVNDYAASGSAVPAPKAIQGGSITLASAYDLDVRAGSSIDVSGGARVKSDGSLEAGNAGSITLATGGVTSNGFDFSLAADRRDAALTLDGRLSAYALGKGGTLEIDASKLAFYNGAALPASDPNRLAQSRADRLAADAAGTVGAVGAVIPADLLNQGGFFNFKFVGRDGVTVTDGTRLAPRPQSWSLTNDSRYRSQPTGAAIGSFAQRVTLPAELRPGATSLTLATSGLYYGDLTVGTGAGLQVDPLGAIDLESMAQLTVLGTLEAPGGSIRLGRPATATDGLTYSAAWQSRSIFLGSDSRLLAGGTTKLDASTAAALQAGQTGAGLRAQGLYRGQVLAGGTVAVDAGLGYLITRPGSLIDVSGAADTINIAASGARLRYANSPVGSAGGLVSFVARDGMFLDGDFLAVGRNGTPGGTFSLRFGDSNYAADPWVVTSTPAGPVRTALMGPRELTLFQSSGSHADQWPADGSAPSAADYLAGGGVIDAVANNGKARLDISSLVAGAFGSWYLQSQNRIAFEGAIGATVANQLRLDSPAFVDNSSQAVSFAAAGVQIGNLAPPSVQPTAFSATPTIGSATFSAGGRDIALVGNFTWSGFAVSDFASLGDIHFDSMSNTVDRNNQPATVRDTAGNAVANPLYSGRLFNGMMKATGAVNFAAAQLYPSTYSDFTVDLSGDPASSIGISRPGSVAAAPFSAAGRIEFKAHAIDDRGTVAAPLGEILFTAPDGSVTLYANSVTTVAASMALPLGQTSLSGRAWDFASNWWAGGGVGTATDIISLPGKAIRVDAANSDVKTGAKLDLSGGGDAFAWEFTPGPGGKTDVMAASASQAQTVFAILPGLRQGFAPADNQAMLYYSVSNPHLVGGTTVYDPIPSLKAGDQISLAANPSGLSGSYTLLPARYALLPGAYLVTVKPAQDSVIANAQTQVDGSWLVSGTRLAANADGSYSAYSMRPLTLELAGQSVVKSRASYQITTETDFLFGTSGARLPGDAGTVSATGRSTLAFDPVIAAWSSSDIGSSDGRHRAGLGLAVDLAAPKMAVVDASSAAFDASWTTLTRQSLNGLGAASLLLGGVRTAGGDTTSIDVVAGSVNIATTDDTGLTGPELLLAATDDVTVGAHSTLAASGTAAAAKYSVSGDGAFLRVAAGEQATLVRTGGVSSTHGNLNVAAGATITGRSLILDATHQNQIAGTLGFSNAGEAPHDGGFLALGANRINVVGDGSTHSDGLTLSNAYLAAFGNPDQIRLTSYSTIDLYGPATLGTSGLKELILGADGIAGHGGAAETTATIQAQSVRFENLNPNAGKTPFAADGIGKLTVTAQTVTFGDNDNAAGKANAMRNAGKAGFALRGFSDVAITAAKEARFEGVGVTAVDAALTIDAGRVVAATGSDHVLTATGVGTIKGGGNSTALTDLGGALAIDAKSLDVSGRIEAPAGKLTLAATGTEATDHLTVEGVVKAEGVAKAFADTAAYGPGGQIVLSSAAGNVAVADGATVSVSGDAGGGDAGTLSLIAQQGAVSAGAGTLSGTAADPLAAQGALKVDAKSVSVDNLVDAVQLGTTSHFTGQWDVRARDSNLALGATKTMKAANVRFAADNGNIDIAGTIDASGSAKGGSIELYANRGASAGGQVTLDAGSRLMAKATDPAPSGQGTAGRGGTVTVGVSASDTANESLTAINFSAAGDGKAAALVDVSAAPGSAAAPGKVVFSVPTGMTNSALTLKGTVTGAGTVALNAMKRISVNGNYTLNTANETVLMTQAQAAADAAVLMISGNPNVSIPGLVYRPGADLRATGSITVANDWNLDDARYDGQPGVLMLHAAKDINVNAIVSDGFATDGTVPATSVNAVLDSNRLNADGSVVTPQSWSYRFVAGADDAAANPLQTLAPVPASDTSTPGSINVAANKLIRTGTGDIALAARRNIKLQDTAAVYTAGANVYTSEGVDTSTLASSSFEPAGSSTVLTAVYPRGGGDISLAAGDNIMMTSSTGGAPTIRQIDEWLFRAAASSLYNTQWWARSGSFRQGVAALGGGDVSLVAGGDIQNFSVANPTNGRVPNNLGGAPQVDQASVQGGGDVTATAGGSVVGGQFYAETGHLRINAGKDVGGNPVIALGNADARVTAGSNLALGNVFNPLSSPFAYVYYDSTTSRYAAYTPSDNEFKMRLGTYGPNSSLQALSVNGDASLNGGSSDIAYALAPGRIKVVALNGDITNAGTLLMTPRTDGQLDLLAAGSIKATGSINQLDVPASRLPSVENPMPSSPLTLTTDTIPGDQHASVPWHLADSEPSRLIALTGDIVGTPGKTLGTFAEAVDVQAAGNILNPWLVVQNNRANDVTRLSAGGNIEFATTANNKNGTIQVNGPGRLELTAGGSVDLGNSVGIVTSGNLHNPYLAEEGASVLVLAGTRTPDYAGFLDLMAKGGGSANAIGFTAQLAVFVDQHATYRTGPRETDPAKAIAQDEAALLAMPRGLSEPFLRDEFFAAIRAAGRAALTGGGIAGYQEGRDMAAALFPAATMSAGNIDFFASQIKTEQGGNIDLLAPGGGVTVGIANPSADQQKSASTQGLFTIRGGNIDAFVKNSFLVNQSRVFTLDGGNILVWADKGSIDAGSGAKTVSATPPPALVIRNGQIVLDTSSSVAGSGIGILASRPDTPASDLDLFAPQGAIDAGDAGLRSTGNVFLGATRILNSANIQAGGTVAGAPAAVAAPAPAAAPSNTAAAQNGEGAAADAATANRGAAQGILTVEVLDIGDGPGSSPDDEQSEDDRKKKKKNNR